MAKTRGGAIVGQVSGSVGSNVFSRNRFGSYIRNRSVPINPNTSYQQNVRSVFSNQSSAWGGLNATKRAAWKTWAQNNPVVDCFGDQQVLTGHQGFIQLNSRIAQAGDTVIEVPPVVGAPDGLTSLSVTADIGVGPAAITFTATPLGASERMFIWGCLVDSPGVSYVKNRYKLIHISAKNLATGWDWQVAMQNRFGSILVGQTCHIMASVYESTTGLISIGRQASCVVTST
jgi:hypothetical protein